MYKFANIRMYKFDGIKLIETMLQDMGNQEVFIEKYANIVRFVYEGCHLGDTSNLCK